MTDAADGRPAPHGGRLEVEQRLRAAGHRHEPSSWFREAVVEALQRVSPCEHWRPGGPTRLTVRTGWVSCTGPECIPPADMQPVPPDGPACCDRCGSSDDVMLCLALSSQLGAEQFDVLHLACRACRQTELPGLHGGRSTTVPPEAVQPSRWLREAINEALERMRPCPHLRPDPPLVHASLVLHSGSMTCDNCPVPPDSAILPIAGPLACDRCGELAEVVAFTWPFAHLLVGYRLCWPCVEREELEPRSVVRRG